MKRLDERTEKEITEIYDMIEYEINQMMNIIFKKTGYYATGNFSLYADEPKKCIGVDMDIALLENPHEVSLEKLEYYIKHNPNNCLNEPIIAYKHNSWYMIYDGIHRTEANKALGNKTIKANIIVPKPENEK